MPEIVETKNRHGETRYGWRCACGHAAGAWPNKSTAEGSARNHDAATIPEYTRNKNGSIVETKHIPWCKAKRSIVA